jgi:phosphoglycerate dehydrogenase-like enzyme
VPARRIRVHVETFRPGESELQITREQLTSTLTSYSVDPENLDISFNDDPGKFEQQACDAEVIFAVRRPKSLAGASQLKWVQSISAGVEALLPLLKNDVLLTNASGVHREKGGEFILTSVLMLNYAIPKFITDKQEKRWLPRFESTLQGKRALLLGVGSIGGEGARLLKERGAVTIGVMRSRSVRPHVDKCAALSDLDTLLPEVDFLISSLPLTSETEGLMDQRRLDLLPKRAGIVSVGRAKVFDSDAVISKLKNGSLAGAVLDVFPTEPVPDDSPFWTTPNLIMTPHCSVDDHSVYMEQCLHIFAENISHYIAGKPMKNVVDPALGY